MPRFLLRAGGTELGFRTLPESSKIRDGVSPPHLAATALEGVVWVEFGIRRRKACLRTVDVDVKYVALTLITLLYNVSASITERNIQFELLLAVIYNSLNTI